MKKLLLFVVSSLLISNWYVMAKTVTEYWSVDNFFPWIFVIPLVFWILALVGFIFWIWMVVDVIKHQEKDKALWVLVVLLWNVIWAIAYYFTQRKTRNKINTDIKI